MKRTGYGRGFRVKASWMMSLLLLLSYIAAFLSLVWICLQKLYL
jgi:hypothetical protein